MNERLIQHEAKPSSVFISRPCLSAIFTYYTSIEMLYLILKSVSISFSHGFIWQTRTAPIFSHQKVQYRFWGKQHRLGCFLGFEIVDTHDLQCYFGRVHALLHFPTVLCFPNIVLYRIFVQCLPHKYFKWLYRSPYAYFLPKNLLFFFRTGFYVELHQQ